MIVMSSLFGALVLWSAGLVRFANAIPTAVVDPIRRTDAIVVLTGGSDRLTTGLRLLAEDRAERLFVSGVHPGVNVGKLIRLAGRPASDLDSRVEAGHDAIDTSGNAAETAVWMRQRGFRSLRLVTSSYHMPRSMFEFSVALPEVEVIPHPVLSDRVQQRVWWLQPGMAALIVGEYNKYLLASVEHWAGCLLNAERWPRGFA